MDNKIKVPVSVAQELVKDIRLLALCGKERFKSCLHDPLLDAGWHAPLRGQGSRKTMERIKKDSSDPAFLHTIAPRCKKLIFISMDESLAALGDSSIFFLERIQMHAAVSSSDEALEFTGIISPPLDEFRAENSTRNAELFSEAVSGAGDDEIKSAFEPVRLENDAEKVRLDSEIRRLYENVRIASQYHNIVKCRKLLSSYIIRYSDKEDYARDDVEKLTGALNNREPGFGDELKNTIAIDLYYRITQGILKGDIGTTVAAIRKYGYIFEGDPNARYFYDIDRLERILYSMISEKGLWDELKKQERAR